LHENKLFKLKSNNHRVNTINDENKTNISFAFQRFSASGNKCTDESS